MPTIFRIANSLSNLFLDVPLDEAPIGISSSSPPAPLTISHRNKAGGPVQQWTADKPDDSDKTVGQNQQWILQSQGYLGGFQIVNNASKLVIGVTSNAREYVVLQTSNLVPSEGTSQPETPQVDQQLWLPLSPKIYNASGYNLINKASGLVLDVPMELAGKGGMAPGLPIQQYRNNSGVNQQWNFAQAPKHTLPRVSISPTGSMGGNSTLQIKGTGFTSYVDKSVFLNFYGVPFSGAPGSELGFSIEPGETSVQKDGTFSIPYTTPAASVTMTYEEAESQWVSCYIVDSNRALLAVASIQLLYFVATSG